MPETDRYIAEIKEKTRILDLEILEARTKLESIDLSNSVPKDKESIKLENVNRLNLTETDSVYEISTGSNSPSIRIVKIGSIFFAIATQAKPPYQEGEITCLNQAFRKIDDTVTFNSSSSTITLSLGEINKGSLATIILSSNNSEDIKVQRIDLPEPNE